MSKRFNPFTQKTENYRNRLHIFSYLLIKDNTAKFKCMYLKTGVLLMSNLVREIDVTLAIAL